MKSAAAVTQANALHMARLYEQSPLCVALFDASDTVRYANPAYCGMYGMASITGLSWADLMRHSFELGVGSAIQTTDFEAWLSSTRSRRGKLPFRAFEADLTDGRWLYVTETVDEQGWMLCVAFDITAMRVSERTLRQDRDGALRAAQTDVLTGISNRAHVLQQLDLRLEQLRTLHQPCGLVMLDLDHFKQVNDTYGHAGGDQVLRHFAHLVVGTLRRDDGFGRLGGEEFMLLLPHIEPQALEQAVGRVLSLVRQSKPLPQVPAFSYTCTAGLVMLDAKQDVIENMRNADRALYQAKALGRDQMVWGSSLAA
ncbi:diguanylate cyclase domain-containing protein [Rhodoferax sp.]|uniref:sensor domain-containing diguanylate cyclase n=1 Tax=Rhodoferax sp. TaxID=50421 RepID=UPI002846C7FB|nr:diguanylate cyclase [Rhodoferax sp.]MDR3367628.1 diguanylate cyclase [Rhodoferax sp.]